MALLALFNEGAPAHFSHLNVAPAIRLQNVKTLLCWSSRIHVHCSVDLVNEERHLKRRRFGIVKMCKYCKYGRYESDDRPCCKECYLNRKSHIVFYKDSYRKCDFLCGVCIKFYYGTKCRKMLDIQKNR